MSGATLLANLPLKKEIYNAAVRGDVVFLTQGRANDIEAAVASAYSDEELLGLTSHGNNIIHVAAKNGHLDFIKSVLENLSVSTTDKQSLIEGSNNDGDTPLHFAAKLPTKSIAEYLISSYQQLQPHYNNDQITTTTTTTITTSSSKLWQIKNSKGNAALHVALMNGGKSLQVATYLLGVGPEVASYTNHSNETPLHLAVHYNNEGSKRSMTNMMNKLNGLGASLDYTKCHFQEDSLSVIKRLLEINTTVCCLQDENGMTPLLKATFKSYLPAVEAIIEFCPESVDICDPKGKTVLHHIKLPTFFEAMKFLKIPEICSLMDQQDEDGNTPLHIAMQNCDYNMVKALLKCNANFVIENKEGNSVATLIQSESNSFLEKVKYDIKRAVTDTYDEVMTKELYEAACNGEWELLINRLEDPDSERHFLTRLPNGSNIIHVVVESLPEDHWKHGNREYESPRESFIVEALKKFPILSCQTNNNGETPLHLALYKGLLQPGGITFEFIKDHLKQIKDQMSSFPLLPWEAKDADGDTLLLEAVRHSTGHKFAEYLIELDPKLVGDVNNHNQTPLHRLCLGYGYDYEDLMAEQKENEMVDLLLEKDATVVYSYDADGFTPLLRAAHTGRLKIAARILHHFPQSIKQFDSHFGRNIFHLIKMDHDDKKMAKLFSKVPQMRHLVTLPDNKINLPLHAAIEQQRFGTAKFLMESIGDYELPYTRLNNDGKTVKDMLNNLQNGPRRFQDFLSSQWLDLPSFVFGRGAYGVHVSDMKDYMSVIGIVAALLTTITFTAAFTVPGGYNQDNGTPIMAKKAAFQVFMFTDVVGMCSSMMTLFCLLWCLNSGQVEDEGSMLVDVSIGLLQLSFYATLVAFMSGVYATISPDVEWMAIFTCTLCSISLILMRKRFILDFVAFGFRILYFISKGFSTLLKKNQT